jgi:two-component system, NtrC family, response regulator AtoC
MTGKGNGETLRPRLPEDAAAMRSILRRARIYLDAGSPASSHDLLSPIGLCMSASDKLLAEERLETLILQLRSCRELGHSEHLAEFVPGLERLLDNANPIRAELKAEGGVVLAGWYSSRSDYSRATKIVNEFLDTHHYRNLPVAVFVSLSVFRFDGLIREGRLDEAEEVASICVEKADLENAPLPAGIARNLLAQVLKAKGRTSDALKLYTQAAARFGVAGDSVWTARVHLNRAALLNRIGHLPEAFAAYEEAHRRSREISHAANIMRSRLGLGMVSIRQGNLAVARRHLVQGWLEARRLKMPREEALALEFLGEALTLMGRPQAAQRALALCRRIATRIAPAGDVVAECGIREALLALVRGDARAAEELATPAYACAAKAGFAWEECQALRLRGIARCLLGRPAEARMDLQTAYDKLQAMGEELEIQIVRRWLARLDGENAGAMLPIHPAQLVTAPTATTLPPEAGVPSLSDGSPDPNHDSGPDRSSVRSKSRGATVQEIWRRLGLATRSPRLLSMLHEAELLALADCAVLVQGETGTGKELLARGIHELSGRPGPLVPVNVGAITPDLFESELFGSEKGAYTGADRDRHGLVVEAEGGTLFLDEIGDIGPRGQVALLRFLDSGEVRRVGSNRISRVKLGVVTATNRLLKERILQDAFRRDLYYRLAQGVVTLPPLRERLDDLPDLMQILWARQAPLAELPPGLLDSACLAPLRAHRWPGNVRELDQFLRRVRMSPAVNGRTRVSAHRIWALLTDGSAERSTNGVPGMPSTEQIRQALRQCGGNRTQAARILGMARSRLYRLLDERGLTGVRPAAGLDDTAGEA